MAVPFILLGGAALAGITGAVKSVSAHTKMQTQSRSLRRHRISMTRRGRCWRNKGPAQRNA